MDCVGVPSKLPPPPTALSPALQFAVELPIEPRTTTLVAPFAPTAPFVPFDPSRPLMPSVPLSPFGPSRPFVPGLPRSFQLTPNSARLPRLRQLVVAFTSRSEPLRLLTH